MNQQQAQGFIKSIGGVESAHKKLAVRGKFKPKAEYFAIHPDKPHLIQMYARNEAKLIPNYSFKKLITALTVLGELK